VDLLGYYIGYKKSQKKSRKIIDMEVFISHLYELNYIYILHIFPLHGIVPSKELHTGCDERIKYTIAFRIRRKLECRK
jgi:hypothetical protein